MTLREFIGLLEEAGQGYGDKQVFIATPNSDGCDTCGYGHTSSERDIRRVIDLETKIVIEVEE